MAGKEGSAPERMKRVGEQIAALIERDVEMLKAAPAPTTHGEAEKAAKSYRALILAARGVTDLSTAVDRAAAHGADEHAEEDDDDEAEPSAEQFEELRRDVERRYARYDRRPGSPQCGDPGVALEGSEGFA